MINYAEHLGWRVGEDFPVWGNNELYVETIRRGYLLPHETPKQAYERVAFTIAKRLKKPELEEVFFKYIWNNWLCLASPVLSNVGTERGLPISCYGIDSEDSIRGIGDKVSEMMTLAKSGGGVGVGLSLIRPAGSPITDNGTSDGVVPFCKIFDSAIHSTSQGCYDDQTQLLTEYGWMYFKDLNYDIKVGQVNDTSQISYVHFSDYIEYEVDEELIGIHMHTGRTGKLLGRVTKNHNMPIYTKGKYVMITAEELKQQGSFYGAFHRLTSLYESNFTVTAGSICKQPHSERTVNANFDFYLEHYKGKVYCITVPTNKLVVRHGEHGDPFICGNSVRRGAAVINLDFEHDDFEEFLEIREPLGDQNRQCLNIHHAAVISDKVMERLDYMMQGGKPKDAFDERCKRLWIKLLQKRKVSGESYIIYKGNVNKANPPAYKNNSLKVYMSNLCCLTGDTPVLTKQGVFPIAELVDKEVQIWDGDSWVANNSFSLEGYDKIYKITLSDGTVLKANSNHRWFTYKHYDAIRRNKLQEKLTTELLIGDFLEAHSERSTGSKDVPGAYVKGFLIGDGTQAKGRPYLNLHSTKYDCEESIITSLNYIPIDSNLRSDFITTPSFGNEIDNTNRYADTFSIQIFKRCQGLTARKQALIAFCKEHKTEFPVSIWGEWSINSRVEFLSGLFDADGCLTSGGLQWSTKHKQLAIDIQLMVKSLGFTANLGSTCNTYRINICQKDSISFISYGYTSRLISDLATPNRKCTSWRKIVALEETNSVEEVYCTSVESTGKFALANGVMTGNSEILLHTDPEHSFVCCLSSLNLARYDEWKDSQLAYHSIWFLDGVLEEFIQRAKYMRGMENTVRSATKGRALGLGVLGWHTFLQQRGLPFCGFTSTNWTRIIFRDIKKKTEQASKDLAKEYGEPLWCVGTGMRNSHMRACAPTVSNSKLSGDVSAGIEPITANLYTEQSAKGTFIRKNPILVEVLEKLDLNTQTIWDKILEDNGSVQGIDELDGWVFDFNTDLIREEDLLKEHKEHNLYTTVKEVFKTFAEINQLELVKQAAVRQEYIDQGVSLNLKFPTEASPTFINDVHMTAWRLGVKTLYYMRSESVLRGDILTSALDTGCSNCEG